MPVTTIFDGDKFGDSDQFDIIIRNSVTLEESQTMFDSAVFGDTDQFDTTAGGVIAVNDLLARIQNLNAPLPSESITVTDSLSRLQSIFRTITESTVSISDSIEGVITTLRNIAESLSLTDTITRSSPTSVRYIYDLGEKLTI